MNRYIAEGIARDATAGKRVAVVGLVAQSRSAMDAIRAAADEDAIYRVNCVYGAQRIDFMGGGWVRMLSTDSRAGRGLQADVLVLLTDRVPWWDVVPIVNASAGGEIIHAA